MRTVIRGIIIFVVLNMFFSMTMYLKKTKSEIKLLNVQITEKQVELEKKEKEKFELEVEARNLESLEIIEKIARNELNMKKRGEEIYRIVE